MSPYVLLAPINCPSCWQRSIGRKGDQNARHSELPIWDRARALGRIPGSAVGIPVALRGEVGGGWCGWAFGVRSV